MPAPSSPAMIIASASRGSGGRGHAFRGVADHGDLRVSDADRAAIADELSRHYGEGRLDQGEFSQRLDQAMSATTFRDLAGLLHDLPHPDQPATAQGPVPPRRHRSGLRPLVVLALIAIVLAGAYHAIAWALAPVLWICVICAVALLAVGRRSRRH
jgi:hypothetical protein